MRICTTNQGKLREFGGMLAPIGLSLTISDPRIDIPETGVSFKENSQQKALGYAAAYPGEWLLAEDSGLCIPALGGFPGPWSARYADVTCLYPLRVNESGRSRELMDVMNRERVLREMARIPESEQGAYFVCCITVIDMSGQVAFRTEQRTYGWITQEPAGYNGFGYDPIFVSDHTGGKTWAEIDGARKGLISHRSKACWDLMAWLCSTKGVK